MACLNLNLLGLEVTANHGFLRNRKHRSELEYVRGGWRDHACLGLAHAMIWYFMNHVMGIVGGGRFPPPPTRSSKATEILN